MHFTQSRSKLLIAMSLTGMLSLSGCISGDSGSSNNQTINDNSNSEIDAGDGDTDDGSDTDSGDGAPSDEGSDTDSGDGAPSNEAQSNGPITFADYQAASDPDFDAENGAVAIADNGDIALSWVEERNPNSTWARYYSSESQSWSQSRQIDNAADEVEIYPSNLRFDSRTNPQVIFAGDQVVTAWEQNGDLFANVRDPENGWMGNPQAISDNDADTRNVNLVTLDSGNVMATWQKIASSMPGSESAIQYAVLDTASGTWSGVRTLDQVRVTIDQAQVDMVADSQGNAHVAYVKTPQDGEPGNRNLYHQSFDGTQWSGPELLDTVDLRSVTMTDDPANNSVALAYSSEQDLHVARNMDNAWNTTTIEASGDKYDPELATLSSGQLLMAYIVSDGGSSYSNELYTLEWSQSSGWSEPINLYDLGASAPEMATDDRGRASLIFRASHSYFSTYLPDSGWNTPTKAFEIEDQFLSEYNDGKENRVEMAPDGTTVATWRSSSETPVTRIDVAISE